MRIQHRGPLLAAVLLLVFAGVVVTLDLTPPPVLGQAADTPTPVPTKAVRQPIVVPPNQPQRGLIYNGLVPAMDGPCVGLFVSPESGDCTHGPDPAPPGVDITADAEPVSPGVTGQRATQVICDGDGQTGNRVQVMYARASDRPDRFAQFAASIVVWASAADDIYFNSAAQTGGYRRIRFVTDAACAPTVLNVVLNSTGDDTFSATTSQLRGQGYNRTDRMYMVFMDANIYCGVGGYWEDDQPGQGNRSNSGPAFGRIDSGCWSKSPGQTPAHELGHNLGAVQMNAPHTSGGGHCVDEYDVMCYSDSPNYPTMQILCPGAANDFLMDCNKDDYFNTNPAAGSYLATHWNIANNRFLISNGVAGPSATPTRTSTPSRTATATMTPTPVDDNRTLYSGVTLTGAISPASDTDTYTFFGWNGQDATLSVVATGGGLDPVVTILRPTGGVVATDDDSGAGVNALISNVTLPASGNFRVTVISSQGASAGGYNITLTLGAVPNAILQNRAILPSVRR